jgi:hypothetical protein
VQRPHVPGAGDGNVTHYHIMAYNKKKDERLMFATTYWYWDAVEKRFLDVSSMKNWKHWIEACEDVECLVREMAT